MYINSISSSRIYLSKNNTRDKKPPLPILRENVEPQDTAPKIKTIDEFLEKFEEIANTLNVQKAFDFIDENKDLLEKSGFNIEELKLKVKDAINQNKVLREIDKFIEEGKFDKAIELVEENKDLIIRVGNDPEEIKKSILNFEKFSKLIDDVKALTRKEKYKEAVELLKKNKPLFDSIGFSEDDVKLWFPEIKQYKLFD